MLVALHDLGGDATGDAVAAVLGFPRANHIHSRLKELREDHCLGAVRLDGALDFGKIAKPSDYLTEGTRHGRPAAVLRITQRGINTVRANGW